MTGAEIKQWRKARKLSQDQLSKILGCAANSVARWEQGSRNIGRFTALAIAARMAEYDTQAKQ